MKAILLRCFFHIALPTSARISSGAARSGSATNKASARIRAVFAENHFYGNRGIKMRLIVVPIFADQGRGMGEGGLIARMRRISSSNSVLSGITNFRNASCAVSLKERPLRAALSFRRFATSSSTSRTRYQPSEPRWYID